MARKLKIRKGDNVVVTTGKDSGKTGEVLVVFPDTSRVLVRGVNIVKRHTKPSQTTTGGIMEREASIHISNGLQIVDADLYDDGLSCES